MALRLAASRAIPGALRRAPWAPAGTAVRTAHSDAEKAPAKPDAQSVAPAGTVFTGLSIYKDKPDPVAKPDSEYPSWLWDLLEDPAVVSSKTLIAGDVDTTGMSKGEARAAYKRSAKLARQQLKKQQAAEAKEAARLLNMTPQQKAAAQAKAAAKAAKDALPKTPTDVHEEELKTRRTLRKKNRASIKASNFVRSA